MYLVVWSNGTDIWVLHKKLHGQHKANDKIPSQRKNGFIHPKIFTANEQDSSASSNKRSKDPSNEDTTNPKKFIQTKIRSSTHFIKHHNHLLLRSHLRIQEVTSKSKGLSIRKAYLRVGSRSKNLEVLFFVLWFL